jgi:hypothetical protein
MAIITFNEDTPSNYEELPWAEAWLEKLPVKKRTEAMTLYFLISSGSKTKKGWILNSLEFKIWVWGSEEPNLLKAIQVAQTQECALVVKLRVTQKNKATPIIAVDDAIPCFLILKDGTSFHTVQP